MILPMAVATGVADGSVSLAFRRWARARVKVDEVFHTYAGLVRIRSVDEIDPVSISEDDARAAGESSVANVRKRFRGKDSDPVFRIGLEWAGPDPRIALRGADDLSADDFADITARLARFDARSPAGPWTRATLDLIAEYPGLRAVELAEKVDREKDSFKLDVRKLKNLGLTLSLAVGYELSERGRAFLAAGAGHD